MIAEIGITILLICNEPIYAVAEAGGNTRVYEIQDFEWENGKLKYYLGGNDDRFIRLIQRRMMAERKQPKLVNQMRCET